ncbi:hypothetical protein CONPUDRAFT_157748 [Coniophora puteana RWD-64-598 SS2]|uniref:Uncharacterized protein n=1 Tax=Coniophora puteana (strain RWD-64-598) TaxID=741705 RepID=A0A5M3MCI5_CONPW|nr:uncharacterized protein CONPUDRAFT_157748 [Coniophora puteana RWD-64-598 SS2]EIW76560.1 hypothetical protein CONPUDRAFT_157748 [Coniophora puteana RWD-64-598 SS2]
MSSLKENTTSEPCWITIGGPKSTKVPIFNYCPSMRIGRDKPPIPVAIECRSISEALSVHSALSAVIDTLGPTPSSQKLIDAVYRSQLVLAMLAYRERFYAVVVGSRVGIYISKSDAIKQMKGMSYPKAASTRTFRQALAYMFAKGIVSLIPSEGDAEGSINPLNVGDAEQDQQSPSITSRSPSRREVEDTQGEASSSVEQPSSPHSYGSFDDDVFVEARSSPSTGDSLSLSADDTAPLVYTHIRNLRGIIGSANQPLPDNTLAKELRASLGKYADYFIHSQGFELRSIKIICHEYREMVEARSAADARVAHTSGDSSSRGKNVDSANVFSMRMARYGMPVADGRFLYYMISLGNRPSA